MFAFSFSHEEHQGDRDGEAGLAFRLLVPMLYSQVSMLAFSSVQPLLCAQLLAEQLFPIDSGSSPPEGGEWDEGEGWIRGFDPESLSAASAPPRDR